MGNLPVDRVNLNPLFFNIELDFAGPFHMKKSIHHSGFAMKVYILCVCLEKRVTWN